MRTLIGAVAAATVVAGAPVAVPGPAQAAHRPAWRVTMKASTTEVTLGKRVVFKGHVNKSAAGKLVVLQERPNSTAPWKNQRDALVHRDGHYRTFDKPSVNKRRYYRVVMRASKHHKRGVSKTVAVDVYKWVSLTSLPSVNQVDFDSEPSVSLDGVTFPPSLEAHVYHYPNAPTEQSVEFNLGHQCTMFRGTFGLSDDSESGSQATVTATADGTPWFDHTFAVGETAPNSFTFETAPLKVRFESSSVIADADGRGAVGTPEVYCEQ
jgi:hypothetical protein